MSTDEREQPPSSAPGVTVPALVSRQHERVALPCLLLRGLSLERDLPTSHGRGREIMLWTPLAVPHVLGRNHP